MAKRRLSNKEKGLFTASEEQEREGSRSPSNPLSPQNIRKTQVQARKRKNAKPRSPVKSSSGARANHPEAEARAAQKRVGRIGLQGNHK